MPELVLLRPSHAAAVLDFERANRAWFATTIPDRGDDYFATFPSRHAALLAEQEAGVCAFYLLTGDDGEVLGRFNLYDLSDGCAVLGYRMAHHAAGQGLATTAVRDLCTLAATTHGLNRLRAATTHDNVASQRVLLKTGFVPDGPADLDGRPGTWFHRALP